MLRTLLLSLTAMFTLVASTAAQEKDKKTLDIRWYGHSLFMVTSTSGTKIAFDPHFINEYGATGLAPDIVCVSHTHNDHNRVEIFTNADSKDLKVYQGVLAKGKLGEWNKIDEKHKDARIRSIGTYHDDEEGAKRGKNAIFVVDVDGIKICHLGDLGHELTDEQVKEIGPVDVLMIPVGGIYTLNGESAKKVVKQLKPRLYILPMHYATEVYTDLQPADEFLDEQKNVLKEKTNLLSVPLNLKLDTPRIVVLGWKEDKTEPKKDGK
jgi:L-ascorbate metabolism protein UlaG (beta-lactamase superfamily)